MYEFLRGLPQTPFYSLCQSGKETPFHTLGNNVTSNYALLGSVLKIQVLFAAGCGFFVFF